MGQYKPVISKGEIEAYKNYLRTLQEILWKTGWRANDALIDILTPDQIDAKPTKLTDTEKDMIEHIDKIFLQGWEKFADLEEALTHIYNGQGIGLDIDLQVALSAYEKTALNQRITIKNRVLTAKSNAIQGMLVDMSNSLKEVNTIIEILVRITGKDSGDITSISLSELDMPPSWLDNNVITQLTPYPTAINEVSLKNRIDEKN